MVRLKLAFEHQQQIKSAQLLPRGSSQLEYANMRLNYVLISFLRVVFTKQNPFLSHPLTAISSEYSPSSSLDCVGYILPEKPRNGSSRYFPFKLHPSICFSNMARPDGAAVLSLGHNYSSCNLCKKNVKSCKALQNMSCRL